jgi:hypothetical protein
VDAREREREKEREKDTENIGWILLGCEKVQMRVWFHACMHCIGYFTFLLFIFRASGALGLPIVVLTAIVMDDAAPLLHWHSPYVME